MTMKNLNHDIDFLNLVWYSLLVGAVRLPAQEDYDDARST
jgi:hypothetical protein